MREWARVTTTELAAMDPGDAVAVLPLGATEQHGPHLPLSTDTDIAEGLLAAAAGELRGGASVLRLPTLAVGASTEHGGFPGTLSVPAETLAATLRGIGAGIAAAGVRRLVLLSAHGGNRAAMDIAALDLRRDHGLLVVRLHYPALAVDLPGLTDTERRYGIHGGALETALMLHLHPDRVRLDALPAPDATAPGMDAATTGGHLAPAGDAPAAWLAGDLDASGVAGDPRLADADLGARATAAYAAAIAEVIDETARRPAP